MLMAFWRGKPKPTAVANSDRGSQFTSADWAAFLKHHYLEHSMSRHGNCHDNAAAENSSTCLSASESAAKTYRAREKAGRSVLEYIEMLHASAQTRQKRGMVTRRIRTTAQYVADAAYKLRGNSPTF
ncbi:MAG: transposase [Burkholderiales bacterium]|nr:MAG: transposase [Burkholderiales bacterium]